MTCCGIAYIILLLEVVGSILDGIKCFRFFFFCFFVFFNCFFVPPSIMRVVFSTCSRYYHQLWILTLE